MTLSHHEICNLLDYSHGVTGLDQFILYGSTPLDLMIGGSYSDIDLATQGKQEEKISALNKRFQEKGFDVPQPRRRYQICNSAVEVILVYAQNRTNFFDVCFMDDVSLIGLFDLESSYWQYPEKNHIDKYNAFEALMSKTIRPIRSFDSENPLLWLSRFVRLCSKYDIPMTSNPAHFPTIESIHSGLVSSGFTHDSHQYYSAIASIFKSILQASNRRLFTNELIEAGFIDKLLPELETFLKDINDETLNRVNDKSDLYCIIKDGLNSDNGKVFEEKLQGLSHRNWEK